MPGPCCLRPWQLGYREDFGFSGFCEPEETELLLQLIVSEGFASEFQKPFCGLGFSGSLPRFLLSTTRFFSTCFSPGSVPTVTCSRA